MAKSRKQEVMAEEQRKTLEGVVEGAEGNKCEPPLRWLDSTRIVGVAEGDGRDSWKHRGIG